MFNKKSLFVAGIILNIMVFLSGCGQVLNAKVGEEKIPETEVVNYVQNIQYEITDIDTDVSVKDATPINLSQMGDNMAGENGYVYEPGCITINCDGSYLISGSWNDCKLIINVYDDEIVHLILDNAELHAENGPVIYVEQANKVVITLKEGTENTISDGAEYITDTEACIFSNSDLTINGNGNLNVYGYYHDAIRSKDRVKILDANLYVLSQNDGIRGNDGVVCKDSAIHVESKGTGILTNSENGYVVISGGSCKVTAGQNAIFADYAVSIKNCSQDLYSVREAVSCRGIREIEEEN